ncbi:MAG TPA: hypothetical protein VG389_20095 [Myxococcota bacterium]|jgi:hypothetical protein|nr:hypothetical protein [Myxococcota bacterium]
MRRRPFASRAALTARAAAGTVAVAATLLWPAAARAGAPHDDSTDAGKGRAAFGVPPAKPAAAKPGPATMTGKVAAVDAPPSGTYFTTVTLDGTAIEAERRFTLRIDPPYVLPFKVGDALAVTYQCFKAGPGASFCDATLRDAASGAVLMILCGSGRPACAPGWVIGAPRPLAAPGRHDLPLPMTHAGRTAIADDGVWRKLATSDGPWLVTGSATRWTGKRPPEARDFTTYAIVRAR